MTCNEMEALLCDYVDGTLSPAQRADAERHLEHCTVCSGMARDAAAVVALAARAERVEPPPQLVTRILFDLAAQREKAQDRRRGPLALLRPLLGPMLQPRFAMGMAMTILSLAMLARAVRFDVRQLTLADLDPVRIWRNIDDRAHRGWARTVKFYENLRFVYEIRSRLAELTAEQEGTAESGAAPPADTAPEAQPPTPSSK
ncbi:MAG: zf-HC2 domain-containing protein [Bryobacterales bacterium]|nr:zf-HC2 domain-containing protein [Bryobacterales bacterium]